MTTPIVQYENLTEPEIRHYAELGYLSIPGFVASPAIERLRKEVLTVLESQGVDRSRLHKANATADKLRQCSSYLKGSALDELINDPRTLRIAGQLLGGEAHRYLPFTAVKAGGGGGRFHMHQDNNYTRHEPAFGSLNIWVALVDMTPENGCLRMVPFSHKGGTLASESAGDGDGHRRVQVETDDGLPIRMRAGDAVAFSRLTVHGSGPNVTAEPRIAYALQYHRSDVRYHDPETGESRLLLEDPRWNTDPLDTLG